MRPLPFPVGQSENPVRSGGAGEPPTAFRVLFVGPDAAESEAAIGRASDRLQVVSETEPSDALDRLRTERVDCVVSAQDLPGTTGLDFFERVRETDAAVPFVLSVADGSETLASRAFAAGVDDYVPTSIDTAQLAERVESAATRSDGASPVDAAGRRFETLIEHAPALVLVVDRDGRFTYVSPSVDRVLGHSPRELLGERIFDYVDEQDRDRALGAFDELTETPDRRARLECRMQAADGSRPLLDLSARNLLHDHDVEGVAIVARDVSERRERERQLEAQNDRLEEFASVVSHDLRNPLSVAMGRLDLARREVDDDNLDAVADALDRMEGLIEDTLALAREGQTVTDPEPVAVASLVEDCWELVETPDLELVLELDDGARIRADTSRLRNVFENLFRNAAEHASCDGFTTVRVGALSDGFYISDDGSGIPEDERDAVLEVGHSGNGGTGFGLPIAQRVAEAHGWAMKITDSESGGARFEFTGVAVNRDD